MAIITDAAEDYLTRTSDLPAFNAWSACGWSKITTTRNGALHITAFDSGATNYVALNTDAIDASNSSWNIMVPGDAAVISASVAYNTWVFWAISVGANSYGYIALEADESLTASSALTTPAATIARLDCAGNSQGDYVVGQTCYVKVWSAALSAAELLAEKPYWDAVRTTNLYSQCDLASDGSDQSGLSHPWTANGTVTWTVSGLPSVSQYGSSVSTHDPMWFDVR